MKITKPKYIITLISKAVLDDDVPLTIGYNRYRTFRTEEEAHQYMKAHPEVLDKQFYSSYRVDTVLDDYCAED